MSRRPSVSIYNYPEALNPFNDESTTTTTTTTIGRTNGEAKISLKQPKHKFWTFGRSKKRAQRSNSFSIKSTWSGLFGKRKDAQEVEIRKQPTIATVSSSYKRGTYNGSSADQQEFDQALGTLARRRKYTLDNSSRYSSSLTVNGDPGRIYEGSPQDTTASIMGDLTPKPPARRFGQVSPKVRDKLPPLDFSSKEVATSNGNVLLDESGPEGTTPVPPKRGSCVGGRRASQRSIVPVDTLNDEDRHRSDFTLRDENENLPDDYVFKRFSRDAVIRQSNLSINSCVSVGSTVSGYGRKKRRAPQPPRRNPQETLESPKETEGNRVGSGAVDEPSVQRELQIIEPTDIDIDIARVTENLEELTKRSQELTLSSSPTSTHPEKSKDEESVPVDDCPASQAGGSEIHSAATDSSEETKVEFRRKSEDEKIEIIAVVAEEETSPKRSESSGCLSRSDSFSVKEVIDNIERQIKYLEAKNAREGASGKEETTSGARSSMRETRKHFFRNMVDENGLKIEIKELPREQKDITIVRLEDPPIPVEGPTEPVKIIQLHISEPIRRKPEIIGDRDVNPIPKPRRHSNFGVDCEETRARKTRDEEDNEKRGNSL